MTDRTRQQVYDGNINWNNWRDELRLIVQNIHERLAIISKDLTDVTSLINGKSSGDGGESGVSQVKLLKAFDNVKTTTKAFLMVGLVLLIASGWIHSVWTKFTGDATQRYERKEEERHLPSREVTPGFHLELAPPEPGPPKPVHPH